MAVGFDTVCFQILEEIRRLLPIKIIACIPCEHQDQKFSFKQQKEYKRMQEYDFLMESKRQEHFERTGKMLY